MQCSEWQKRARGEVEETTLLGNELCESLGGPISSYFGTDLVSAAMMGNKTSAEGSTFWFYF